MSTITTIGGRVLCKQCEAKSKRSKLQCRGPAVLGKSVCRMHGGSGSGPKTEAGRQRCADARTIHGNETRQLRTDHKLAVKRLADLETLARALGMITGSMTRGRKPG